MKTLALKVVISFDPLADSLVEALRTSKDTAKPDPSSATILCWFPSSEWKNEDAPAGTGTEYAKLNDAIFAALDNRQVHSADICLVLYARDAQNVRDYVPLYQHFESFLNVVTTRRLYVIYPRRATELEDFRENLRRLLDETASSASDLREVHLMIAPEETSDEAPVWPPQEIHSFRMVNLRGRCRAKLDELLTSCQHRCCSTSYGALVFKRELWRMFHVLRSCVDLTRYTPPQADEPPDARAAQFARDQELIVSSYAVDLPPLSIGTTGVAESLNSDESRRTMRRLWEQFLMTANDSIEKIAQAQAGRYDALDKAYRAKLIDLLNGDKDPLEGFRQALWFHRSILKTLQDRKKHRELIETYILREDLVPAINHVVTCINAISGRVELDELNPSAARSTVKLKLDQMGKVVAELGRSDKKSRISSALQPLLATIDAIRDISSPEEVATAGIEKIIERSFAMLDDELGTLRDGLDAAKEELDSLKTEFPFINRIIHPFSHRRKKDAAQEKLTQAEHKLQQQGNIGGAYAAAVCHVLTLCWHLKLVFGLLAREKLRLEQTARALRTFEQHLMEQHAQYRRRLNRIPVGPMRFGAELCFLSRTEMEELYQRFGPAAIPEYVAHLIAKDDKKATTWGNWALTHVSDYLLHLNEYCQTRFETLPRLDLPALMFNYFGREIRIQRLRQLTEMTSRTILPLCEENLGQRRCQMLIAFPDSVADQLQQIEPDILYEDPRTFLGTSEITYVNSDTRMRLELNLAVCGFPPEDYLYWDIFRKPGSRP